MDVLSSQGICRRCGKDFQAFGRQRKSRRYCSSKCRKEAAGNWYQKAPSHDLAPSTVGAAHELTVCADLLKKGYAVFRSVSPSSPFDLVAFKDGRFSRVEVTTGFQNLADPETFSHPKSQEECEKSDVLAVVFYDGRIEYEVSDGSGDLHKGVDGRTGELGAGLGSPVGAM